MQEQGVVLGPEVEDYMQSREAQGQTCVLVGINGKAVAALAVSDPLKPEAVGVVAALERQVRRGCTAAPGFFINMLECLLVCCTAAAGVACM
jgi:cation transport ATPase